MVLYSSLWLYSPASDVDDRALQCLQLAVEIPFKQLYHLHSNASIFSKDLSPAPAEGRGVAVVWVGLA